jgi:hypothetical protein
MRLVEITMINALIAAFGAFLGASVSTFFTYRLTVKQKKLERYKKRLIQAYRDIASFHRLEEKYADLLSTKLPSQNKTSYAWKLEMRKQARVLGLRTPSNYATAKQAETSIEALTKET